MATKTKISVTISTDMLERIDRAAKREGDTRSGVIDRWLKLASRAEAAAALRDATAKYYDSLTADDRAEDEAIARASSRRARRLQVDDE